MYFVDSSLLLCAERSSRVPE